MPPPTPTPLFVPSFLEFSPESDPSGTSVLPLLAPELLMATVSGRGERLSSNDAWDVVFGTGALWEYLPAEDRRFANEYIAEAAAGGLVTNQVFLVARHHRDLPAPVLLNFLPVRLNDGTGNSSPVMITGEVLQEPVSWAADQTKRRRMEMLGQMAMGIAHDFNNLLTTIIGHAELLKTELADNPQVAQFIQPVERAAMDGAALVRKIQRYIRHEKAQRFEPLNLSSVLEEVAALTRPYWQNEPRRKGISIELKKDLQKVPYIRGVEAELREVFVNLVLNAVQAMPEGGTLTLRVRSEGNTVIAEVEDTGTGMAEAIQQRIFEPLFTTKGEEGTGMGLTVSYGIVQEHDGGMTVKSEEGAGTRFTLRFPVSSVTPVREHPPSEVAGTAEQHSFRLLVVDDEAMVRGVATKLLRLKGHIVEEASSGTDALQKVAERPFDLVVTDLGMPEMSGRELAYHLRQHHPSLAIILLTGHTDAEDSADHVDAVVKKPFQIDALQSTIQRLLSGRRVPAGTIR